MIHYDSFPFQFCRFLFFAVVATVSQHSRRATLPHPSSKAAWPTTIAYECGQGRQGDANSIQDDGQGPILVSLRPSAGCYAQVLRDPMQLTGDCLRPFVVAMVRAISWLLLTAIGLTIWARAVADEMIVAIAIEAASDNCCCCAMGRDVGLLSLGLYSQSLLHWTGNSLDRRKLWWRCWHVCRRRRHGELRCQEALECCLHHCLHAGGHWINIRL
jgi:hypothetical protein